MRDIRLYCRPLPVRAGETADLSEGEAFHAARVLRLDVGAPVTLMDGRGSLAEAVIVAIGRERRRPRVRCRIETVRRAVPPALQVHVCVAPPKGKSLMRVVRQCVELGADRLTPLICRRSVDKPGAGYTDRAHQEAVAAMKQSGNPFLPALDPPVDFETVLRETAGRPGVVGAADVADRADLSVSLPSEGPLTVWVGPEGGFTPEEIDQLIGCGVRPVRIGTYVLRVDTAVTALLGWILGPDKEKTGIVG